MKKKKKRIDRDQIINYVKNKKQERMPPVKGRRIVKKTVAGIAFILGGVGAYALYQSRPEILLTSVQLEDLVYLRHFAIITAFTGLLLLWETLIRDTQGRHSS